MQPNPETNKPAEALKTLYNELKELDQDRDAIDQKQDTVLAAIEFLESKYNLKPQPQQPDIPESVRIQKDNTPELDTDLSELNVDFSVANRLIEKFFLVCAVAHAVNKLINTGHCAQYLLDHQQSQSKLKYLKGSLSHMISDYSDYFELVQPGTYRYRPEGFAEPEESANPEPAFDEE